MKNVFTIPLLIIFAGFIKISCNASGSSNQIGYRDEIQDTLRISRLTDDQVKEIIHRCFFNIKDTIYYGEYHDDVKYGYSRYATFLDSSNIEYGSVIIMDIEVHEKMLIAGTIEKTSTYIKEIYQLIPPYKLIIYEVRNTKNGTSVKINIEKKGDYYIKTLEDGIRSKIDSLDEFEYSLNESWAPFFFGIDSLSKVNTILETNNNLNFEDYSRYTTFTKLVKREKKLVNGLIHTYITTEVIDSLGNTTIDIEDENLTIVESKVDGYLHRFESKEIATNFEAKHDFSLSSTIQVDPVYCKNLPPAETIKYSKVLFEYEGNKNPFEKTLNQLIFSKNKKNYIELNSQSSYVSIATMKDIEDNLKETNMYPIYDKTIIQMAAEATKGAVSEKKKVELLFKFVNTYIKYSKDDYSQHFISVYDIIRTKNGVCSDFAELFTVLARSIGIPCKTVGGFALDPDNACLSGHAWNEVEINGMWYGVDPTWNQWLPSFYHFKENKLNIPNKELNSIRLKLKRITFLNGKVVNYD